MKHDPSYPALALSRSIPSLEGETLISWAEKNIRLVGSVRSERFDVNITPWLRKAYESIDHPNVNSLTLAGPAQSGKSALGEIVICHHIATRPSGDVQYNWESNEKGKDRYRKRVWKILENCRPVKELMPKTAGAAKPLISFSHLNFTMQGVSTADNLESDSVTLQINEELHSWKDGRKKLADQRLTAVWNSTQVNISTGGIVGDQLDMTYDNTTKENWEEPCDECGKYQHFHAFAADGKLGGLRYETFKKEDGTYDMDRIAPTIHYECEHCGNKMYDDYESRRRRSLLGRYPLEGFSNDIGLHMEQVSVYWIPYRQIVQQKLEAILAMRRGDKNPWIVYIQRSEAGFYDPRYRPYLEEIKTDADLELGEPLEGASLRGMTVDKQQGSLRHGETPHFWVVVRDWKSPLRSRLLFEDRVQEEEQIEQLREKFGVKRRHVLVDSGHDATGVYHMCHKYGYTAIKGASQELWMHIVKGKKKYRIYAPIKRIDPFFGTREQNKYSVALVIYSKSGIRDRLESIREIAEGGWEVPAGVSDDYKAHMASEEKEEMLMKDGRIKDVWVQHSKRNDLFVCECYQALLVDLCDLKNSKEDEKNPLTNHEKYEKFILDA